MYDIFFVSQHSSSIWNSVKNRFPNAQLVESANNIKEYSSRSFTKMYWLIWDDLILNENFDLYSYRSTKWDDNYIHVFKNGSCYDGICLIPKSANISQRELDNRFFINKKEIDITASFPITYDKFYITSYEEYLDAVKISTTSMFYVIWPDIEVNNTFLFNYQVPYYDQHITHVFKNGDYYDGICLFSKKHLVTKKEFEKRFFLIKKEIDIQASSPKTYEIFHLDDYQSYEKICRVVKTNMFYAVWNDVVISSDFKFDYQVPYYNQQITHVFKNGQYYDGICLFSKNNPVTNREYDKRYFVVKKEIDVVASYPVDQIYDIIFISYNESNADSNFAKLKSRFSRAKRVHGVKGIHQAHVEAAKIANTEMFYVVDGDAVVVDDFNFNYAVPKYERLHVHVWRSQNPLNHLEYGYGGIKLLPRDKTLEMDLQSADMTTSISNNFKVMPLVSNVTYFNTDPFNTWKSAFRECAKLASAVIARQESDETIERLNVWCTIADGDYASYAIQGANAGRKYGEQNKGDITALKKINDFEWLKKQFDESQ